MKRFLLLVLALGLVISVVALAGCGKKETTIKTPEGEVTVKEGEGGELTIRGEEGETTYKMSEEAPSEEELGVPIYPGAEYVVGSGGSVKSTSEGEEVTTASGQFTTGDDIEEVISWYRDRLGAPMIENASPREVSWMKSGEDYFVTVSVNEEEGKTTISIARFSGTQ